jgi:cellulose synthase/poly-beta-1,6-N-acetylglucosamine synthase-like glycosyltransferase
MCVRAQALKDIGGYDALPDSVSGDDDFLLQAISRHPTWRPGYSYSSETHVRAAGPAVWPAFLRQKRRHISAGRHYRSTQKLGYILYHLSNYGLWLSPVLFSTLLPLMIKLLIDYTVLVIFMRKLENRLTFSTFLLWQPLFPAVHLLCSPGAMAKNIRWIE